MHYYFGKQYTGVYSYDYHGQHIETWYNSHSQHPQNLDEIPAWESDGRIVYFSTNCLSHVFFTEISARDSKCYREYNPETMAYGWAACFVIFCACFLLCLLPGEYQHAVEQAKTAKVRSVIEMTPW